MGRGVSLCSHPAAGWRSWHGVLLIPSPPPLLSPLSSLPSVYSFFSRMCLNLCSAGVLPLPFFVCQLLHPTLRPHGLLPTRLLCPWDSPGKNTGMGGHSLLQGIFLTQGLSPGLLKHRQILYRLSHQGGQLFVVGF